MKSHIGRKVNGESNAESKALDMFSHDKDKPDIAKNSEALKFGENKVSPMERKTINSFTADTTQNDMKYGTRQVVAILPLQMSHSRNDIDLKTCLVKSTQNEKERNQDPERAETSAAVEKKAIEEPFVTDLKVEQGSKVKQKAKKARRKAAGHRRRTKGNFQMKKSNQVCQAEVQKSDTKIKCEESKQTRLTDCGTALATESIKKKVLGRQKKVVAKKTGKANKFEGKTRVQRRENSRKRPQHLPKSLDDPRLYPKHSIGQRGSVTQTPRKLKYVPFKENFSTVTSYRSYILPVLLMQFSEQVEPMFRFQIENPNNDLRTSCVISLCPQSPELQQAPFLQRPSFSPFSTRQAMCLCLEDDSQMWYTYVASQESTRNGIKLILKLFAFRQPRMLRDWSIAKLKLLPGGAVETRMLDAIVGLESSDFVNLVLGKAHPSSCAAPELTASSGKHLNNSQRLSISSALKNKVTVIKGPPGTGKTSVILEIVRQLLEENEMWPILCVAPSNIAVDNLCDRLLEHYDNNTMLRVSSAEKEQEYTNENKLGQICLHNIVFGLLPAPLKLVKRHIREEGVRAVDPKCYQELVCKEYSLKKAKIGKARVICTTNLTAGSLVFKDYYEFGTMIMDESTQASELSALVPLTLPGLKKIVLVGDEKQLSCFGNMPRTNTSFFERTLRNGACKTHSTGCIQQYLSSQEMHFMGVS